MSVYRIFKLYQIHNAVQSDQVIALGPSANLSFKGLCWWFCTFIPEIFYVYFYHVQKHQTF